VITPPDHLLNLVPVSGNSKYKGPLTNGARWCTEFDVNSWMPAEGEQTC
jgi:hypothetical protein